VIFVVLDDVIKFKVIKDSPPDVLTKYLPGVSSYGYCCWESFFF